MHPMPINFNFPGKYSKVLYESGFGAIGIVYFPSKFSSDLIACFDFSAEIFCLLIFFYLLIVVMLAYMFETKMQLKEAALLCFRVMLKGNRHKASNRDSRSKLIIHLIRTKRPILTTEHNLNIKKIVVCRRFYCFLLIYHLLLAFIVETSLNTSLVVNEQPAYYDSIDHIYENKLIMVSH